MSAYQTIAHAGDAERDNPENAPAADRRLDRQISGNVEAGDEAGPAAPSADDSIETGPQVPKQGAPDAAAIRARIERIYADGTMLDEHGLQRDVLPVAVTERRGAFIADLCRAERPAATLEIGFGCGLSTLHILAALAEQRGTGDFNPHLVIDPYEASRFGNAGLRALHELGADPMVEFYAEPSAIVLPRMVTSRRRFDLVFIDGDHRFDGGFVDLFFVDRILRPGGLVIFDDVQFDGIYLTTRWAETNLGYRRVASHGAAGPSSRLGESPLQRPHIGAWRKPLNDVERDRFHFEPFFGDFVRFRDFEQHDPALQLNRLNHAGLLALRAGDHAGARRAFAAAIRLDPLYRASYLRWMRTFLPRRLAAKLTGRTRAG